MRNRVAANSRAFSSRVTPFLLRLRAERVQPSAEKEDTAEQPRPLMAKATEAGWPMNRRQRSFLRELDRQLRMRSPADVAILVGRPASSVAEIILGAYPEARVTVHDIAKPASDLHTALAADGPFHLIVDDTARGGGHVRVLRETFFHLVPGGSFLCRRSVSEVAGNRNIREYVGRITGSLEVAQTPKLPSGDHARLASAIEAVRLGPDHLLLTNRVAAWAKMREHEVDSVLERAAGRRGRVLERRRATELVARSTVRDHAFASTTRLPATISAPPMSLREYLDVTCAPFQVAVQQNLVLPDTYRHNQYPRLANRGTEELAPRFARPVDDISSPSNLPGAYFYLDSEFPGHYGHAMTEQMSRLWAWEDAKRAEPSLKALVGLRPGQTDVSEFERGMFEAVGIDRSDMVLFEAPVRVEKLLAATPMLSMPDYVHPEVSRTWDTVGAWLEASAGEADWPSRIFCSRRRESRWCDNAPEVEEVFARHGFEIVYPEDFPFAHQAAMFRRADVVAGYSGSALFTLAFCDEPKRVVMISSESYTATNEYLIAAVQGHEMDVLWCEPHERRFSSGFSFDFDREGVRLQEVLSSLEDSTQTRLQLQ